MSAEGKVSAGKGARAPTLYFIVAIKFLKGFAALALALGVHSLRNQDLPELFQRLLEFFHLDPEKKFFADLADRVAEITPSNLHWVAGGATLYGLFMLMQAVGLAFRVRWIVWLVLGEAAFFVPVEIFEIVHRPTWVKLGVLAVNVFIVWYLFANRARLARNQR